MPLVCRCHLYLDAFANQCRRWLINAEDICALGEHNLRVLFGVPHELLLGVWDVRFSVIEANDPDELLCVLVVVISCVGVEDVRDFS